MMNEETIVHGLTLKQWKAAFRSEICEFAASTFVFTFEGTGLIRIAFGNAGPHLSETGGREPVFTHSVTIPADVAVDLAGLLLKKVAEPELKKSPENTSR
ncbi:hypothetical protein [Microbaculum marinisediminis]|uniref:Uncharacterized protein n=1 Tax=Microbaculum marinisediminis TaxID=2931392 RepID=A0AAW5QUX7_9HYPH|nr:hypothetical protein [Microbaculum sp. A6E488]MCT8971687.1 hypothetical protein [Microbaculum sp. A6E488]